MVEKLESGGIKFLQKILLQSFKDKFDIEELKKFNSPATPGTVLKKPVEGDVLLRSKNQTLYRSGVEKAMHMMQYSWPDIYQMVRDLARHMGLATEVHWDAMFRMMKYVCDTKERGLTLNPTQKWDGGKDHEFVMSRSIDSDYDYAKDMQTQKSISGYVVYLEGAPVMFKSSTQKSVALSADIRSVMCARHVVH